VTSFDSAGNYGSKNYTLNVNPQPSITTNSLPNGTENTAYSKAVLTSGGTAPFTWSYTGTLPSGITFDTNTGTFGGTPDANSAGTYNNIQVTATDLYNQSASQTYSITVNWVLGLSPALPAHTVNVAYNQSQDITGGSGNYSGLNVVGLPSGLTASLSGTQLTFSGTPTATGTFPLSITLHDDGNNSDSTVASASITINAALGITTASLPNWTETIAYNQSIATTGGTGPLTFSLSAGVLPNGLSLNTTNGLISGTPSVGGAGTYPITVLVTDAVGATASHSYSVTISALSLGALSFNQWTLYKTGFIGTIAASTGTGAFTLTKISGKLPIGMAYSLSGGLITFAGKPTIAGTYTFALKLTDSLGASATQSYTIVVNPATTLVWTGLGVDANWMTAGNWGGGTAPLAGYTLVFGTGAAQKTANNNFPIGTRFFAIRFADSGYTITGNDLKLSAGISSTSTGGGTDTVALNVALLANEIFNIGGTTLIDVTGTISGTKLGIIKTGAGTLAYNSPAGNTYTGLTTVSGGTLKLNAGNQIVDTTIVRVNPGAAFDLNGHDESIASLTLTGGTVNTGAGTLTLSGNITSNIAIASAAINGNLNLTGVAPTLIVNNGPAVNDLVIAADISTAGLTKIGLGTLVLSGNSNTYAGTTKVSGGVLDVTNSLALGSGPVLALKGTTLQLDGNGLTFANTLTLGSAGIGAALKNLGGSNTWSGAITDAFTSTFNVSAGTLTINGAIGGTGGLIKSGVGTLVLPSANSYMGITSVNAGVLDVTTPAALGSNALLTVAATGTLQLDGNGLDFNKTLSLRGTLANLNGNNTWSGKIS
jgi:autotransporter-associated beta strand protein